MIWCCLYKALSDLDFRTTKSTYELNKHIGLLRTAKLEDEQKRLTELDNEALQTQKEESTKQKRSSSGVCKAKQVASGFVVVGISARADGDGRMGLCSFS